MSTQQPEAPSESAPAAAAAAPAASDPATSVVGASDPAKSATAASASATSAQAAPATTAKPATETGKRRRKKSRWGEGEPAEQKTTKSGRARKKSRWGAPSDQMAIPANAALATRGLTPAQTETFLFRVRLEQITQKLANPAAYVDKEDLGPEPAPIYDQEGKRVNTREKRFKDKLIAERQKLLEKALSSNPALRALAPGFQPAKKVSRIDIPTEKYPGYNFIGLIIGPRGNTQKRMEKETKCKISIRGKGSSKKGYAPNLNITFLT
jgi:splicing factor 1